ncbi:MucB/RseB C-terminal domain-containing protein [Pseudomonas sp. DTU_2021_1001937_2_SI_NGA_ILE_001]|uniref:MucB/RseB C-terminal domain-containing protein n=1 Tax=Pseudomonas sp. DTU_2021_1001937_2_SI_NGA_ILE_001 TaxID=3077589 RepID=UPI0028FC1C8D|nr:MucB/RseB C-terminal domain-containing protein [Pseudomonas sp. DTU_2021_1001937_2_SI_NGA_ILE_001]WNW11561.1 MucB/RseB C-terminal domain-containing protein [Pseudomonas sp. DTU_2021_1001937_2_SI_NGA_ILE_001]
MRATPLWFLLFSGWLAVPAHADDAQDLLKRLAQAEQQQSFQGAFIYERNGSFSTHRIWHEVLDGKVRERLLQLDGSAQEIVRVDGLTQCVSGTLVEGLANLPDPAGRILDAHKLSAWYDLKVAGKSRVAGRPATILVMSPKDQHRYGVEMHLDDQSGMVLKSLLLSERGVLLERFQFVDFDPSAPSDQSLLSASADCKPVQASRSKPADKSPAGQTWRSDWLPSGFELTNQSVRKDHDSSALITSQLYGDGLTRFSVFIEPLGKSQASDIRTQFGPTAVVSRRLATGQNDAMITVVGEIPVGTAERIALSMRPVSAAAGK